MGLASIELTASLHAGEQRGQDRLQPSLLQAHHDPSSLTPTELARFHDTVHGVVPAAQMDQPLLDDHGTELGIHFTQNPPGIVAAPAVHLPILLPTSKTAVQSANARPAGRRPAQS